MAYMFIQACNLAFMVIESSLHWKAARGLANVPVCVCGRGDVATLKNVNRVLKKHLRAMEGMQSKLKQTNKQTNKKT